MSGQRSADSEGTAASVAPGCSLRETKSNKRKNSNPPWFYRSSTNTNNNSPGCFQYAVFSWGRGEDGQLGLGDASDQDEPTFVDALRGVGVAQIAAGSGHTVVLTTDGEVFTWGRGDDGRLGHGENMWKYVPRMIQSLAGQAMVQVTCGSYHTAAVAQNGDLYTWGGGMYGKLGHGNEAGASSPKRVEALVGLPVSQIACGSRHTAVVTSQGIVYTWGDKENGVAGHGDHPTAEAAGHQYAPRRLERLAQKCVTQISACGFHTAVVTDQGELFTWGEGKFGRLGHYSERNCHAPQLVEALLGKKPRQVSCGGFHTAVVTEDGRLYTFGGGEHGQLGHNDRVNKLKPTLVQALEGIFVSQITCGWSHSVALTAKGKVYTWGNGDHGKLGHGSGRKISVPHIVDKLKDYRVVRVASYNEHTAALVEPFDSATHAMLGVGLGNESASVVPVTSTYAEQMRAMVNDEEYSDVTFLIENEHVYAHKAILAQRCEPFCAMFRSGMRESAAGSVIPIPNIRKQVFLLLLEYLYTDTIKIDNFRGSATNSTSTAAAGANTNGAASSHSSGTSSTMTRENAMNWPAIELYICADLYDLERLREICLQALKRNLNADNAGPLLQTAADNHCQTLKDHIMNFVVDNFDKVSKTDGIQQVSHGLLLEILSRR
mmetsp:Transcript_14285/g.39698  ORF Transcript_14285/g.39698 Transcript_14285/m.39698 type:complete len:660 (+) Transcript_14285:305-2284(+)